MELLGLVGSMVLRCDDCVTYHIIQCADTGVSDAEFFEAFNVALIVGGVNRYSPLKGCGGDAGRMPQGGTVNMPLTS